MSLPENWIWLPREHFPLSQTTKISAFLDGDYRQVIAEFRRQYSFSEKVIGARLRVSGDTYFELYLNGEFICTGPACVGGDFISNERVRPNFYSWEFNLSPDSAELDFFARVRMLPRKISEYSKGHGGFMLSAELTFDDGMTTVIYTDETWQARENLSFASPSLYDSRLGVSDYYPAEVIENLWNTATAPTPPCVENTIRGNDILLSPFEEREVVIDYDKIHTAYVCVNARTAGKVSIEALCREQTEDPMGMTFIFDRDGGARSPVFYSVGNITVKLKNNADTPATVRVDLISTHYPVEKVYITRTDDEDMNRVFDVCRHTLKICRQTHHLDSPRHSEPLACTGDYYIETLMTSVSFGDLRLSEFDAIRTAELLRHNDGRLFHTTYSLIYVSMLLDIYKLTGNRALLCECEDALRLLLHRFETYIGKNGLIETPPDYMFVDWIYTDEISMHHPPKALGQTCLNMFYFGALGAAAEIFDVLEKSDMVSECLARREAIRDAINSLLFDKERGVYFEGLNTPTNESLLGQYMPQNVEKRYYMKHSNVLAAYYGVCNDALSRELIRKVMTNECKGDIQPYFLHYLFEAIYRCGLRDVYTKELADRWKAPVLAFEKGLVEGFVAPEPGYPFDHSHAWGGTPLYSVPKALLGLEINQAGYDEITLSPSLCGYKRARVEIPTPHGDLICELAEGRPMRITCPADIRLTVATDQEFTVTA